MSEQEIEALRERWRAEMSPSLTLELAEQYRRRDELASALEVLEAGVAAAPDHLATRLAKGRCHLDLEQAEEARGELHRVVRADPAHLAANRLLVDAHARLGERGRARDRLGFFELLSGDRQEVAELARLLEEPDDEPFVLSASEASRGLEMDAPGPAIRSAPARAPRGFATVRVDVPTDTEPFVLDVDESDYRDALASEGLFAFGVTAPAAGPAVDAGAEQPLAPSADEPPAPTLTLAKLYRKQGHHEEAARILRAILERQPGNPEAARALVELQKEHGWRLSAEDLLGAGDPNRSASERTADRLLKRYRERLRGGG